MTGEPREVRVKRLAMRSMRRGIKEMDVILSGFADAYLADLNPADLDAYESMLSEHDHDLYAWVSGSAPVPSEHAGMIERVRKHIST